MILLKIGGTDYSSYVNKRNYEANQEDETVSWKDANSIIHTTVLRTRVKAKVELVFTTEQAHTNFVNAVTSACVDGYWAVQVYVNNVHLLKTITARIDMTTKAVFGNTLVNGNPVVNSVKLEIEEV